jgi:ribonucleoside-diphosphate reductase alpha chain
MHITVAVDLKTGREIEIFSQIGKSGAATAAELEGICRLASLYLRAGGHLRDIIKQLKGIGSVLDGLMAGNESATSVPDSLARALEEYVAARDKHGMRALVLGEIEPPADEVPPSQEAPPILGDGSRLAQAPGHLMTVGEQMSGWPGWPLVPPTGQPSAEPPTPV